MSVRWLFGERLTNFFSPPRLFYRLLLHSYYDFIGIGVSLSLLNLVHVHDHVRSLVVWLVGLSVAVS